MKLICLGDSLTEGYGQSPQINWPSILMEELGRQVVNSGISGDTTTGMLTRLSTCLASQPDLILIMGGTNDVICSVPHSVIVSNIMAISRQCKKAGCKVLIGIPPRTYDDSDSRSRIFQTGQALNSAIDDFRLSLTTFCEEDDQIFIDFNEGLDKGHFEADGVHPTVEGRKIMALTCKKRLINL